MQENLKFNGKHNKEANTCRKNVTSKCPRILCGGKRQREREKDSITRYWIFALLMQNHCGLWSNDCSLFATEQTLGIHYTVCHNGCIGFIVG